MSVTTKGTNEKRTKFTVEQFITGFAQDTLGKVKTCGGWKVRQDGKELWFITDGGGLPKWGNATNERTYVKAELAAVRVNGVCFSNANRFELIGTRMAWGSRTSSWGQSVAQRTLEKAGASPIPFNVFTAIGASISQAIIIEKAPSETVKLTNPQDKLKPIERHYVGACLLNVQVDNKLEYFLFDIDRQELEHGIFNAFVVKLSKSASSIFDAYVGLMPERVQQAIGDGVDVKRQGEWFFIKRHEPMWTPPVQQLPEELARAEAILPDARRYELVEKLAENYRPGDYVSPLDFKNRSDSERYQERRVGAPDTLAKISEYTVHRGSLRQGNSRPNTVEKSIKIGEAVLCSGLVKHSGREHKDLMLNGWYEAVPNTAVGSWQLSGDID